MVHDVFRARLPLVLGQAPELVAYQRFLDASRRAPGAARDYLYTEDRPRFEPRKDDVVVALPGLEVRARGKGSVFVAQGGVTVELPDVPRAEAARVLAALDGQRCLLEVRWEARVEQPVLGRILRAAFGRVLFAPGAADALERRLPFGELVRFPSTPYAVDRTYWQNMADVRAVVLERLEGLDECGFVELLRELHVLALMGHSLESFYKPPSPASDDVVVPGALSHAAPRLRQTPLGTVFLDGLRVKLPFVGGEGWHAALASDLGDEAAMAPARSFHEEGLAWGEVVTARSEREDEPTPLFLPPRPLADGHFAALCRDLLGATRLADRVAPPVRSQAAEAELLASLARFHQRFVRLHPFPCANQSLAMNLVNALLVRAFGAGIPHLALDHLALRLDTRAYAEVFARAVRAFAVPEADPARRLAVVRERVQRSRAFIDRLSAVARAERPAAIAAEPEGARLALLAGGPA